MEKKIEDYLHLYLGCDCEYNYFGMEDDVPTGERGRRTGKLGCFILQRVSTFDPKLILRPITDMTDEEVAEICKLASEVAWGDYRFSKWEVKKSDHELFHWDVTNKKSDYSFCVSSMDGDVMLYDDFEYEPVMLNSNYRFWYLKKGFDIFGLIESGLAIGKTTINAIH